jgi:hypothetical protein
LLLAAVDDLEANAAERADDQLREELYKRGEDRRDG